MTDGYPGTPQPAGGYPGSGYGQGYPPGQDAYAFGPGTGRTPVATGLAMKRRTPVASWIGLPLITLGIYHYVRYYKIHKEMAEFDRRENVPVSGPLLVLIFLSWTLIGFVWTSYNCGKRIGAAQRAAGLPVTCSPGLGAFLMLIFGVGTLYHQIELNKVVDAYGAVEPGTQVPLYV